MPKSDSENSQVNNVMEGLVLLVRNKNLKMSILQEFLEANKGQLDFDDDYNTAVGIAVSNNVRCDLLELLLQYGLSLTKEILCVISDYKNVDGVQMLLDHNLDPSQIKTTTSYYSCNEITQLFENHLKIVGNVSHA